MSDLENGREVRTANSTPAGSALATPVPAQAVPVAREDFDKMSADLTRAKNLLVRLHSAHPAARAQIEGSTGNWFIWGTDRDATPAPAQAVPAPAQVETTCGRCQGTGTVDDGYMTHSFGGVPFDEPIKCVKDCPACNGRNARPL